MAITEVDPPAEPDAPRDAPARAPVPLGRPAPGRPKGGYLPYFPALDGIRAVAVVAVLLFHGGFSWAVGGYLGVSTFFTLSGFLITSLLLAERNVTSSIDLKAFWVRRFRRLMPASLVALALILLFGLFAATDLQRRNVQTDVLAALGYVANWRFVVSGQGYNAIFSGGSPVQHFWSLAIEEQFYFLYPLLAWVLLRKLRVKDGVFALVLGGLTALSVALPLLLQYGTDRLYYGTDSRAAELLVGGLLAVLLNQRRVTEQLATRRGIQIGVAALGAAALLVCINLWRVVANDPDASGWLYSGGFFGYSVLSASIVLASLMPIGPVRAVLATPALRWIGQVSYGVYVYHWPIFLWVDRSFTDMDAPARFALKLVPTFALAAVSSVLVEQPVRKSRGVLGRRAGLLAPVCAVGVALAAVTVSASGPEPVNDFERQQREFQEQLEAQARSLPPATAPPEGLPPRPRIATFGDSTALETGFGLNAHYIKNNTADFVYGAVDLGCSIMRGNLRRTHFGAGPNVESCNTWDVTWKAALDKYQPNIGVIQVGPWELADQKIPGDTEWRALGDVNVDEVLLTNMIGVTDMMADSGALAVWLTMPTVGANHMPDAPAGSGKDPIKDNGPGADPARKDRFNQILAELQRLRPDKSHVIDLGGWLAQSGEDERLRPDGIHFSADTAEEVSNRFLGPAIIDGFQDNWVTFHKGAAAVPTAVESGTAPRVLWVGDSVGLGLAMGMGSYAADTGEFVSFSIAELGCGIGRGGKRLHPTGKTETVCEDWSISKYPSGLSQARPDIVVIADAVWDTTDRLLPGDDTWRAPGDPVYDSYLVKEFGAAADLLHRDGATVVWLTYPHIDVGKMEPGVMSNYPANEPARMDRMNELIREAALGRPWFVVVDLAERALSFPKGEFDEDYRPDGVHFTATSAERLLREWLAAELKTALAETRKSPPLVPDPRDASTTTRAPKGTKVPGTSTSTTRNTPSTTAKPKNR